MSKRHKDALICHNGPVNPLPITKALHEACMEAHNEGKDTDAILADPAVLVIMTQLCYLTKRFRELDSLDYYQAYTECEKRAQE